MTAKELVVYCNPVVQNDKNYVSARKNDAGHPPMTICGGMKFAETDAPQRKREVSLQAQEALRITRTG